MRNTPFMALLLAVMLPTAAHAHVPYFEKQDLRANAPFLIENIEQSKAIYAYLENSDDADALLLVVREPVRIYAKVIIPFCVEYQDFRPSFALIGPGLPDTAAQLPVELNEGEGALLRQDLPSGPTRPSMFEFFSDQVYFEGPILDITVTEPGMYWLWFWDEAGSVGDYVAIVGKIEEFSVEDIQRSFWNTPEIRRRDYLHVDCAEPET
jgi:hypothetical protein